MHTLAIKYEVSIILVPDNIPLMKVGYIINFVIKGSLITMLYNSKCTVRGIICLYAYALVT